MNHIIEGIEEVILRNLYEEETMPLSEIADYFDIGLTTVWRRMNKFNIKRRTMSEAKRIYAINKDFFKEWNQESAWLFGWAEGDGGTTPQRLFFNLSRRDKKVLYKFKEILQSEHPIADYEQWDKRHQKYYKYSKVQFYSTELVADLKKLSYLEIPPEYFCDFTRGFFEAEGTIRWEKSPKLTKGGKIVSYFSQNDRDMLTFIHGCLRDSFNIVKGGGMRLSNGNTWRLTFGVYDSLSLYHFMYDECNILYLPRKKWIFEELIRRQKKKNG